MESKVCSLGRMSAAAQLSPFSILPHLARSNQCKAATLIKKLVDFNVHLRRFSKNQQAYKRLSPKKAPNMATAAIVIGLAADLFLKLKKRDPLSRSISPISPIKLFPPSERKSIWLVCRHSAKIRNYI